MRMKSLVLWFCLCGLLVASAGTLASARRAPSDAFTTTAAYVVEFYPLWFTYHQTQLATPNRLVGPDRISPVYHVVVAINDDTVYVSSYLDLTDRPVVLTIPATPVTYSVLTLDAYGNVFDSSIAKQTAGTFGLFGPGFSGTLPPGVTPVAMPVDFPSLIFRADKFSSSGDDQTSQAKLCPAGHRSETLT